MAFGVTSGASEKYQFLLSNGANSAKIVVCASSLLCGGGGATSIARKVKRGLAKCCCLNIFRIGTALQWDWFQMACIPWAVIPLLETNSLLSGHSMVPAPGEVAKRISEIVEIEISQLSVSGKWWNIDTVKSNSSQGFEYNETISKLRQILSIIC